MVYDEILAMALRQELDAAWGGETLGNESKRLR
jgi:hypothetical protein